MYDTIHAWDVKPISMHKPGQYETTRVRRWETEEMETGDAKEIWQMTVQYHEDITGGFENWIAGDPGTLEEYAQDLLKEVQWFSSSGGGSVHWRLTATPPTVTATILATATTAATVIIVLLLTKRAILSVSALVDREG